MSERAAAAASGAARRSRTRFPVHVHQLGPDHQLALVQLANFLQQAAGDHVAALGLTARRLEQERLAWVLIRQRVNLRRLPTAGEEVVVETWASHRERQLFYRQFVLRDRTGAALAEAVSAWALFDLAERKSVDGPGWVTGVLAYDTERVTTFPAPTIPRLREGEQEFERSVRPRWADLDLNRHVNNAQLFGWLLEALPVDLLDRGHLRAIDLIMRAECRLEDEILSRSREDGPGRFRHHLVREADGREIARGETMWVLPD